MFWKPYVSVAKRREQAAKKIKKLVKKGEIIQPVILEGKKIVYTFWGKAWCDHIESLSDDENRLPRGRTYVRNGSVCHLEINTGVINALVSGSELYQVKILIQPLPTETWSAIKKNCSGKISSLIDLLSGQLSKNIMDLVCDENHGLFPKQNEIKASCNCPDWSTMCKHIAAVLYGVGARLDSMPDQLFQLRAVNYADLIDIQQTIIEATQASSSTRKRLDSLSMPDIFGIDFTPDKLKNVTAQKTATPKPFPKILRGSTLLKKREKLKLTKTEFAQQIGISISTLTRWENLERVDPKPRILDNLRKIWTQG